jgi:hypothetical protein
MVRLNDALAEARDDPWLPGRLAAIRRAAAGPRALDETLWYAADWDLWLRLASGGRTAYLPEPRAAFRLHAGAQTIQRAHESVERERQLRAPVARFLPRVATHPRARHIARRANGIKETRRRSAFSFVAAVEDKRRDAASTG